MERAEVVVVGGGFAGASTAWHLARRGVRDVVVLEREQLPGTHSSGLNAGMARQAALDAALTPLAVEGAAFLREPPAGFADIPLLARRGSVILGNEARRDAFERSRRDLEGRGVEAEILPTAELVADLPVLAGARSELAFRCAGDGLADVAALLDGFLRGARASGTRVLTGERVVEIELEAGRVSAVRTARRRIATATVVDAAGAWAGQVGELAGAAKIPFSPCRRHLATTGPLGWADPGWPFVWDVENGVYFRPEPPGLLLSPCDEEEWPPGFLPLDPEILAHLGDKLGRAFPSLGERLGEIDIASVWAGFRTLVPDRYFVLGRDPFVEGFHWCAGLGGHGMTTSPAVGRIVAESILDGREEPEHSPARFVARPVSS